MSAEIIDTWKVKDKPGGFSALPPDVRKGCALPERPGRFGAALQIRGA